MAIVGVVLGVVRSCTVGRVIRLAEDPLGLIANIVVGGLLVAGNDPQWLPSPVE